MYMLIENVLGSDDPLPVACACSCLDVSRSGFYEWKKKRDENPLLDPIEMRLKDEIQKIAVKFSGYGYRRVTKELHRRGFGANSKRVHRIMQNDNLLCIRNKFRPVTTDSNHSLGVYPNLAPGMELTGINQLWVSDITYIQLAKEFIYLAVIIDVFSKKCIGWELDRNIDTQLTLNALDKALKDRWSEDLDRLVHHSDRGVQYASHAYVERLKDHNIIISMSRKGNPYDNAFAESFIKTLKCEEVYISEYEDFHEAYRNIWRFIEQVYNEERLHSSIGYLPPNEFEVELALNSSA